MASEFPLFKTKVDSDKKFNLSDPSERWEYFHFKAGLEIEKIKTYLEGNSFIAYMLGKKNSGKGTYSKLFIEIFGKDKVAQLSIGDLVRSVHQAVASDGHEKQSLIEFLKKNYRGYLPIDKTIDALLGRDLKTLLPTEFILALLKREISKVGKKALFLDGFPRNLDQVSYSLFFRELIGYRDDPDFFILIDLPEKVIEERMKYRRVCPLCQTSRNLKLFPTTKVGYRQDKDEFYLECDNPDCQTLTSRSPEMIIKEGQDLGMEGIRERLATDADLINKANSLYGIPKILLRNFMPVDRAEDLADGYEITPEYSYAWDEKEKKVSVVEKPWIFPDDSGIDSVSFLAPPVVISLIKQLVQTLNL
ncbi:nucleoside monophosphate kinase [Candidatus Parcubacteria bacterium]|nr:nucleoside monophosphate kinase [Candidatus Parcubacteria bacterium]